ncbi:GNAT family N-acetyltransferase [Alkalihalobacillus sp. AL-G]|uniref:GNAT family N-acetyltransferase n=1 Tax=Alkalihalobacillus sp. AL-G TaxID=2926399 RepID=UPI00272D94DA|nr:GNAT family protein [Alkalihalobacillus sp. AL-G]WLD94224.1 GNAT family N-acetyltransferase [Alkalihalobacillus sp. AL-G]
MWVEPVTLKGEHVTIRPMEKEDLDELYNASGHEEIWSYMPMNITSKSDMELLIDQALEGRQKGNDFPFVIHDNKLGKLVGSTRFLDTSEVSRNLEIGWTWLSPDVWRTPVNTECKYLLLMHCFESLKTIRVQLKTDGRNIRSQNAIERIGAIREGVLRKSRVTYTGFVRDTVYFSILESEWPEVKKNLERQLDR